MFVGAVGENASDWVLAVKEVVQMNELTPAATRKTAIQKLMENAKDWHVGIGQGFLIDQDPIDPTSPLNNREKNYFILKLLALVT